MYCNRSCARCKENLLKPCCKNHITQVVHYLAELFDREKIKYWLHFGTLLAAVRDNGNIIPWDSDADMGVIASVSQFRELKKKIEADGYGAEEDEGHYLFHIGYSYYNWGFCDVFLYEEADIIYHGVGESMSTGIKLDIPLDLEPIESDEKIMQCDLQGTQVNHTCDFPSWFVEELDQRHFEGKLMKCPRHPEKFVELIYGPNWHTPIKGESLGYCGNYYPLSHWIDYVELQKKVKQPKIHLQKSNRPFCRFDTLKCQQPNTCCEIHLKELMDFAIENFRYYKISFIMRENSFFVKKEHYQFLKKIKKYFNQYYFVKYFEDKIYLCYSQSNRNKIVIYFE